MDVLEKRIETLETKFAFQQDTIDSLNKTVTEQWNEIDRLNRKIARFEAQIHALEDNQGTIENTRPPHY